MSSDTDKDRELEMVKKAASALGEHFDTVQIFVSRHEGENEGNTITMHTGVGNWYARHGQVQQWLVRNNEQTRIDTRSNDD